MSTFDLATATAPDAWDRRWRNPVDRAEWSLAEPEVREVAAGLLAARNARHALDLGCGVGRHALLLARAGFAVTAIDAAPAGVEACRAAAAKERLAIRTDQGLMTDLPYADASFDYVLAFNVAYHGDAAVVRRTIAEIHRVLAPGGLYHGTMLSKRHAGYGRGREIAPDTFLGAGGADEGHAQFYCDARGLTALFADFEPLKLEDRLHSRPGSWHWHLLAERRP